MVDCHIGRDLQHPDNSAQRSAVALSSDSILQIVAGPGSGKTTVLVLRALRHVLVDDILPEHILITTFTRKAATELRTRWLDWGSALIDALADEFDVSHIDINKCRIDTLDATIHDVLTEYRTTGTLAPVLSDTTASVLVFKREIFQRVYVRQKDVIDPLLARYTFEERSPRQSR